MKYFIAALLIMNVLLAQGQESTTKVYRSTEVDSKPNLKDGMYALTRFISQNFVFPENISNKQVKIFTSFIVEPDGSMTDVRSFYISVKDLVPSEMVSIQTEEQKSSEAANYARMQAEAGRVLNLFDEKWIPGQVGGKPVRCLYNYPISFNLE